MKVVVFYSKQHSGHHHAALAIAEGFDKHVPGAEVIVKNSADFFEPWIGNVIEKTYMFSIRRLPWVWSWMYDNDLLKKRLKHIKRLNLFLDKRKLLRFIRDTSPDFILCTQAVPCEMICILKFRGVVEVPLIAVPTDFFVHSYWIHPEVDAYLVACERSKRDLMERGISEKRIVVTGIPVRPSFVEESDSEQVRENLGLEKDRKTVLMMGGGLGLVPYGKLIDSLTETNHGLQIISVLGVVGKRLERVQAKQSSERVRVLGYVNNVHELMAVSDLIVSKPGGLTCAEILAKGLAFVITNPLPGQEEENVHYMLSSGCAVYADSPRDVARWVGTILETDGALEYLSSRARAFGRPNAVRDIARTVAEFRLQRAVFESRQDACTTID